MFVLIIFVFFIQFVTFWVFKSISELLTYFFELKFIFLILFSVIIFIFSNNAREKIL